MGADYYKILGIGRTASFGAVRHAYEQLKRQSQGDSQALQRLEEAYHTLGNPINRANYDKGLSEAPAPSAAAQPAPETESTQKTPSSSRRPVTEVIDVSDPGLAVQDTRPATKRAATTVIEVGEVESRSAAKDESRSNDASSEPHAAPSSGNKRLNTDAIPVSSSSRLNTEAVPVAHSGAENDIAGAILTDACQVVITDQRGEARFNVEKGNSYTIGRPSENGPEPDIKLYEPHISREHAMLTYQDGALVVIDNGSRNGTRLNGERLEKKQPHPLREHDRLEIETYTLQFRSEAGAQS